MHLMGEYMVDLAKDFSRAPAGRFISDGPNSGERFRSEYLEPNLKMHEKVVVLLDGTRGLGSSFLEEAFGGLRRLGFTYEQLTHKIDLVSKDSSLVSEIRSYWK